MRTRLLSDRELVVRCTYCTTRAEGFLRMVGHIDGRSICPNCGHFSRFGDPNYQCFCGNCRSMRVFPIARISLRNDPGDNTGQDR